MAAPVPASYSSNTLDEGTNLVIDKPAGLAEGDLMVACVSGNGAPTLGAPGSWTAIGSAVTDGFSATRMHRWYKVADSGDVAASNFTFTRSTTGDLAGGIVRIYGYNGAAIVNVTATGSATGGTSQTSPSVTTTVDDCLILRFMGSDSLSTTITTSGVTNLWNVGISSIRNAGGWETQATAGSTGTESWTFNIANQMVAVTVAIQPGSDGGGSAPIFGVGATATVHYKEGTTAAGTINAAGVPDPAYSITGGANAADYSVHSSTGVVTRDSAIARGAVEVVEFTATNANGSDVLTVTYVADPVYSGATPAAPLDDADYYFQFTEDYDAGNTQYPNLGTRDEPLVLGPSYAADGEDPTWTSDGTLGNHLVYTDADESYATTAAPQAVLDNQSFTVAVRVRWDVLNTIANLCNVMHEGSDVKDIFLHKQSDNTYEGRVWDSVTASQVPVVSTTQGSTSATQNIVLTFDGSTREILLYINGVEEDDNVSTNPRRVRGGDYFIEFPLGTQASVLHPDCKYFRQAYWTRCLSPTEVADLETNDWWMSDSPSVPGGAFAATTIYRHHFAGAAL